MLKKITASWFPIRLHWKPQEKIRELAVAAGVGFAGVVLVFVVAMLILEIAKLT
ncbi:hypothetical protein HMI48_10345 [Acidithiobacillus ferrooxidans]|uniref:hypothetical protein n=1 Tax=Acidithiobacillus ferrooxidans TaxID=920 RepID=UPI001C065E91|nr:hypothetical protein [Acidithiobacillus ferrooxidans]MBU2774262.1 hypothetical protein [Acidithiobacillus ferrooxidans]